MSGGGDSITLLSEWAVRPADLQDALLRYQPHIVHISAHSGKDGGIMLERDDIARDRSNENEKWRGVGVHSLMKLFNTLKGNIQLVFLNSCYTKRQAAAISRSVDYAIGINREIGDKASIILASSFYGRIFSGLSVKTSFELAVNHLDLLNLPRANAPVLFMRDGADYSKPIVPRFESTSGWMTNGVAGGGSGNLNTTGQTRGIAANRSLRERDKKKQVKRNTNNQSLSERDEAEIRDLLFELKSLLDRLDAKLS